MEVFIGEHLQELKAGYVEDGDIVIEPLSRVVKKLIRVEISTS